MPPPIQSNAGSRAALITWTVITSILFVVAAVLAIFAHVDRNKVAAELKQSQQKYAEWVSESDFNSELRTGLQAAKTEDPSLGDKLVNVAVSQRELLAKKIAGVQSDRDALIAADAALKQTATGPEAKPAGDTLVAAITSLNTHVKGLQTEVKQLEAARDDIKKRLDAVNASFKTQIDAKDADIAKAREEAAKFQTSGNEYRGEKDKQVQEMQAAAEQQAKLALEDVNKLQAQQGELTAKIKQLQQQIDSYNNRLKTLRLPVDQIIKQADARIMRLGGNGVVYIDLGQGDQVTPGMSFEVFDRLEGIPKPGDVMTDENLPKGKASIEIIKVSPGSSECRVIRTTPGMTVVEGDLCVNVVYDRNIKYNFVVYGKFDLDRNGQATPQDADVIKRLVTSWGGKVVDKLTVDTDFVVFGKVPEIPNFSAEDMERPEVIYQIETAKKELQAYDEMVAQAQQLNIPILNQNRFLYFTGYYEQSGR
jgi:hypothetical protein